MWRNGQSQLFTLLAEFRSQKKSSCLKSQGQGGLGLVRKKKDQDGWWLKTMTKRWVDKMRLKSKQDLNDHDLVRDAPSRNPRAAREPGSYILCCNLGASAIRFLLTWDSPGETTDTHAIYRAHYVIGWMDTWRVGCKYGWKEQEIQQRSRGAVWTVAVALS